MKSSFTQYSWLCLIILLTFISFAPALNNKILNWDDTVSLNPKLISSLNIEGIKNIFLKPVNTIYAPLTTLSFAFEYHFFKHNSFIYHLDNLLLHCAVSGLVFFFYQRLRFSVQISFIAALIFAIHPMRVESVAWITERKDFLYSIFYLLAMHSHLSYLETKNKKHYLISIIAGLFSMLSKPMAVSLPLILLLLDWYHERDDIKRSLIEKIPFLLYLLPLTVVTHQLNHSALQINPDLFQAILIFIWTFTFYLNKFFFPITLVPLYQIPKPIGLNNFDYILSLIILAGFSFIIWRYRKNKLLIFSVMFFICSIFFLLRFEEMPNQGIVADRFMYLPSLGFCLLISVGIFRLFTTKYRRPMIILLIALFLSLGLKTFHQSKIWKDSETLWTYVIQKQPAIGIAYNSRGHYYLEQKHIELAFHDFQMAIQVDPLYTTPMNNLALMYYSFGNLNLATEYLKKILSIMPTDATALDTYGLVYDKMGQPELAIQNFSDAISHNPDFNPAYYHLAKKYYELGKLDQALKIINANTVKDFTDEDYYNLRGAIYGSLGKTELSITEFSKSLQMNPHNFDALNNMGVMLMNKNQFQSAIHYFNKTININPQYSKGYLNRSKTFLKNQQFKEALKDALKAQELGEKNLENYLKQLQNSAVTK